MQESQVILTATEGCCKGQAFVFKEPGKVTLGRASDCDIQLPPSDDHPSVSRHHCLVGINPPHVWVRDLGSLNGTFVNGAKIGQRSREAPPVAFESEAHEVKDGDVLQLGSNVFQVHVEALEAAPLPWCFPVVM